MVQVKDLTDLTWLANKHLIGRCQPPGPPFMGEVRSDWGHPNPRQEVPSCTSVFIPAPAELVLMETGNRSPFAG